MSKWSFRLALCALVLISLSFSLYSQNTSQSSGSSQSSSPMLKPQLSVSDLVFTLNTLASVNINGSEVEAYIDVKNTFTKAFEQAQKDKKGENDMVTVELSVLTANNFLQLFQRASLQGSAAEKFMNVKNALYASAPKAPNAEPAAITPPSTGSKK